MPMHQVDWSLQLGNECLIVGKWFDLVLADNLQLW